jgi:hypothetical protein
LVIFATTIKSYIPLKTDDKIKAKLKSGEYILERRHAKSEVRKSFHEIQDAATKDKICAVQCLQYHSV